MPKIHELLERDPRTSALANKGQARIAEATETAGGSEDRAELESFVCDGQFADGLQRILEAFLGNLGGKRQDAAWVSGFFGSGKSHLLKMLAHLWSNQTFVGAAARSLVPGGLPPEIQALFRELDTRARQAGRPAVAAAGTLLEGNERVRSAVLQVLLRACRLPTSIPQARFTFWLRDEGILDQVRSTVKSGKQGRDWRNELSNFLVSRRIAEALLQADPAFASGEKEVRKQLRAQFPPLSSDLTTEEFVTLSRKALAPDDGPLPLTVLVIDEAQQYIGDSGDRSAVFAEVSEAVQTRFDSRVALVASGQAALSGTPALQKLRDRFRIKVELTDADVETVTRKVLLTKKASRKDDIEAMFTASEGEVSRHLQSTGIGPRTADRAERFPDYPLLSTRRRFWEAALRAVDSAGVKSQLRSQLWILHSALTGIADCELGTVIPASDLFHEIRSDLVNSGVLLNKINTRIQQLEDGSAAGRLRQNLTALVFLIGKLPREAAVDMGVRADATTLADLLVEDVTRDSGPFRQEVAKTLEQLVREHAVMQIGAEYRIQTTEGAEWDSEFQKQMAAVRNDDTVIGSERDGLLLAAVEKACSKVRLRHGNAKERRSVVLHRGSDRPSSAEGTVPVWLRDGWQVSREECTREARAAGSTDPTLHVFVPKQDADSLRQRIVEVIAAKRVLDHRGTPSSSEGKDARASMESRRQAAAEALDGIVRSLLREALVLQGGGGDVFGDDLEDRIRRGAEASLARLFPRFSEGDHVAWATALKRAAEGSDQPFAPVGWEQDTDAHPVPKEVMTIVGPGARGTEVHRKLTAPPLGWPRDAVDAALIALHHAGHLRATRNGDPVRPGKLTQATVKSAVFQPEEVVLTVTQLLGIRGLLTRSGISVPKGSEQQGVVELLQHSRRLAERAGGDPPLPVRPNPALLDDLAHRTGNEQLRAVYENVAELDRLREEWTALGERRNDREPKWKLANALRRHAEGLAVLQLATPELDAVRGERRLLEEPDHVAPQIVKLASALRDELARLHAALAEAIREAEAELVADPDWTQLDGGQQDGIRRTYGLVAPEPPDLSTEKALLRSLNERSLSGWRDAADAVPTRMERALNAAREHTRPDDAPALPDQSRKPTTIRLRRATLADEAAVRAWVRKTETALLDGVRNGPVILK